MDNPLTLQEAKDQVAKMQEKYEALETAMIKMMQFVPVDERELFLHTLSSKELERVEVAEIVSMIKNQAHG